MSDKKQSSIEWLLKTIFDKIHMNSNKTYGHIINQAKAMHKEEIKDAFYYGLIDDLMITDNPSEESELYYNQTFKQ